MRDFSEPVDNLDLVERMHRRREASVNAEYPVVDDDRESEKVEHVGEVLPDRWASILPHAFRVEAVGLRHRPTLMVPPNQLHTIRIPQFEAGEKRDGLDAEEAAVDVVAEE